jgi:hypothetical protein
MQRGFTKLFNTIVTSTIWQEDDKTRIVWITMLAIADAAGIVGASIPGLASVSNVSVNAARSAVKTLLAPDADSRTKDFDGRRIEEIDGGWRILNHAKYRRMLNEEERKEYKAKWIAEKRRQESTVDKSRQPSTPRRRAAIMSTQAEAEAEAEAEKKEEASDKRMPTGRNGLVDSEWIASLKADKTYEGIDVDKELGKLNQWCKIRQLTASRRRFINWLNRAEKPMIGNGSMSPQHRQNRINFLNEKKQKTNRQISDPDNPPSWAVAELARIDAELKKL